MKAGENLKAMDRIQYAVKRLEIEMKILLACGKKQNVVCHAQGRNTAFTQSNETSLTCCNTQETFLIKLNYKNKFIQ